MAFVVVIVIAVLIFGIVKYLNNQESPRSTNRPNTTPNREAGAYEGNYLQRLDSARGREERMLVQLDELAKLRKGFEDD